MQSIKYQQHSHFQSWTFRDSENGLIIDIQRVKRCAQGCPREDLPPSVLFFIGTVPNPDTPCSTINPPCPPFQGGDHGLRALHRRMAALPASSGPASEDALLTLRTVLLRLYSPEKSSPVDATRKSLIITALSIFRVGIFLTLKMVKQLSLSDLQVTFQCSARQQGCPREDLPHSVLFFIGTLSQGS